MVNYEVVESESSAEALVIRDLGPWDQFKTITNGADEVVASLYDSGRLRANQKLYYYDSEGCRDELLHEAGIFVGFKAGPDVG